MSWKDILLDFLHYAFFLLLISIFIVYFLVGDRLGIVYEILKSLVPFSFFGMVLLIKLKIDKIEFRKRKKDDDLDIKIYLTYFNKFLSELLIFLIPIVTLTIAILDREVDAIDILQAAAAFLLAYLSHYIIFKDNK